MSVSILMSVWGIGLSSRAVSSPQQSNASNMAEPAKVLVVHSYALDLSWTQQAKAGIDQEFQRGDRKVTVYHEFLDAKRYPKLEYRQQFLTYLKQKYQATPLNAVMVADDPGVEMMMDQRRQFFPQTPVVFLGVNRVQDRLLNIPWLTGVFETHSVLETVLEAKRQTKSDNLIILTDSSETGRANQQKLRELKSLPNAPRNIVVIENVTVDAIAERLGKYPASWPILIAGQLRDDAVDGPLLNFEATTATLRSKLPNPLYADSFMHLGNGIVGGKILSGDYHAQQAVQLVKKILDGVPVDQIKPVVESKNQWIFDIREIQRHRIDQAKLPAGSILRYRELSFYERYRSLVWGVVVIVFLSTGTIIILLGAVRRQNFAEAKLRENEKHLEQRVDDRTKELSEALRTLKATQAQLIRTEKMSSLGQLAGGMAHEFNNPLTFIRGNLSHMHGYVEDLLGLGQLCKQQITSVPELGAYLDEIDLEYIRQDIPKLLGSMQSGADRIENLVDTLQQFSGADEMGVKPQDLNQRIEETLQLLNAQISHHLKIVKSYQTLPLVDGYPGELSQVFLAILSNAIDAMQGPELGEMRQITIATQVLSEDWVRVSVCDTGQGIPAEIQDKIFDPFFTTKPVGQGTGMGLALCLQTVELHNGKLSVDSTVGEGTRFVIELPVKGPAFVSESLA